jgi:hypothetical protein
MRMAPSLVLDDNCLAAKEAITQELDLTCTLRESRQDLEHRQERPLP